MWGLVDRHRTKIQLSLMIAGSLLSLIYVRNLHVIPPQASPDMLYISPRLYDWATIQFGLALVVLGLSLSNRSVVHRFRFFRLSRWQRLGALGCAILLMSPWLLALVGSVAGFDDPFYTVWFIAYLSGFLAMAGLFLIGVYRAGHLYFMPTDRFPYVEVDMSRRQALMAGAALLGASGTAAATARGIGPLAADDPSQPEYLGSKPIVYERPPLVLRPEPAAVRPGDTITFEVHHTGESESVSVGCEYPWAIQAYNDGEWHHVVWTATRWHNLCASGLPPGETHTIQLTLSEEGLAEERYMDEVNVTFTPGTYRFILVGTDPALAVNFQVLPAE